MSLTLPSPPARRVGQWDAARLRGLAEEHGTPLYVTDIDRIRENYQRIDRAFSEAVVQYAAKANTGQAVIQSLHEEGAKIECAASTEVERALRAGIPPEDIQYTAMNPPTDDLDYIVDLWEDEPSLIVTVGAEDTLDRLLERGFDGNLLLRVNPGVGVGHHEKVTMGKDAKFGIPFERVPDVVEDVRTTFDFLGLHAHVGSGILNEDLESYGHALTQVGELVQEVGPIDVLDIGGGFGVPYHPDEEPLDLNRLVEIVHESIGDIDAQLMIEPGRYIVADASVLVTRVNTRKETPTATVIGTDASMSTMMRPSFFDAYHPIRNLSGEGRPEELVSIGGPLCTSADSFCTDRPLPRTDRGDLLAIGNAGAYGYEFSSNFHSQLRPAEVALEGEKTRIVRRRETVDDLMRLEQA